MDASIVASNEAVKLFFLYFHKGWWAIIILAILLRLLVPDSFIISSFLINFAATFLLIKVATLIHECGHLVAARISGGTPRRMVLGIGDEIFRTRVQDIRIIVNSMPFGGRAWADFSETDFTKWKFALYAAGGVVFNLLIASVFYPNSITLGASIYLMVAFHHRGDLKSRDMHLNFVKKNIELLEVDERMIFERNAVKIGL